MVKVLSFHHYTCTDLPLNYLEEQEYLNALKQLALSQMIKDKYESIMQEERTIQQLENTKRYANEVVYPAIAAAKKTVEERTRTIKELEETKRGSRELRNAIKEYRYNVRLHEADNLNPEYVDESKSTIRVTVHSSLPPWMEEKE